MEYSYYRELKHNYLIVKNAKDPETGRRGDIKIPLDPHGRMLINYRHGSCDESFKNDSVINLSGKDIRERKSYRIYPL